MKIIIAMAAPKRRTSLSTEGEDWFDSLTKEQQAKYLKLHPGSEHAKGGSAKPEEKKDEPKKQSPEEKKKAKEDLAKRKTELKDKIRQKQRDLRSVKGTDSNTLYQKSNLKSEISYYRRELEKLSTAK